MSSYVLVTGMTGESYVPVNLLYQVSNGTAGGPTVSVTSPTGGTTVSGSVSLTASATTSAGASINAVQFQIDGLNVGDPLTITPYTTSFDSTSLSNATHHLTAIASDTMGHAATSAVVNIAVNNKNSNLGNPLISAFTPGSLRNNYANFVGMEVTVGASPIRVTSLGRVTITGNSGSHIVKLVQANGSDVAGGAVTVSPGSGTNGQFTYAYLPAPITLTANATYYLVSQESLNGDQWYDIGPVTTAGGGLGIAGPVYNTNSGYVLVTGLAGQSYVPVNLIYTTN